MIYFACLRKDLHRGSDHAYDKDRDVLNGGDMDREPTVRDVLDDGDMDREPTAHDVLEGGDMDREPTVHDALDDGDMDRCHVSKVLDVWGDHVQGVLDE